MVDTLGVLSPRNTDAPIGGRERWRFGALLVVTAAAWLYGLDRNGWANSYYSAAVQAGTQSWKAFLFGSADGGNAITVDKPPAALWPMEISARIFGVNTWSIQVPQVLLGVASVALLYVTVRKHFGSGAALIAGAMLALTPVATLMFRFNNPDALLVFLLIAAVWALTRALADGRTRWIVLCGIIIGFGFLAKQLQVMLIVPTLGLTYLVCGPARWATRAWQLTAGVAAIVATAGWWVLLIELTPAARRPYVGGSADNSFLNLTFAYNGLDRLRGSDFGNLPAPPSGMAGPPPFGGDVGWGRLFNTTSGSQISWLLPAALVFLVAGLLLCAGAGRGDATRTQYLLWGGWLVTTGVVFSFMSGIYHDYYTVALAPAVSALTGMGVAHLWQQRDRRWTIWVLAIIVAATGLWASVLLRRTPDFVPVLRWLILAAGMVSALSLIWCVVRPVTAGPRRGLTSAAVIGAVIAACAGPLAYSLQTLVTAHTGGIVTAGPADNRMPGPPGSGGVPSGPPTQQPVTAKIVAQLLDTARTSTWVAAAKGSMDAAPYQLATGRPVLPLGGFGSGDPSPTLGQFQQYVSERRVHYFIAPAHDGPPGFPGGDGSNEPTEVDRIAEWITLRFKSINIDGVILFDLTDPK
ncbi:glycosyl transferase [Mycobacteroides immunogenum]|uniref:Glycosyl transferase n=1 Tax=Mycobacteroides immunogenum TaxID=83262 RepID=A0A179VGQ5_9MYCO|nr:glycosyltransferase family 39 protein [Mycobacteroides immunogenum]OAT70332.1 glycosyl transferase [Mycobacteroides immunogenum]